MILFLYAPTQKRSLSLIEQISAHIVWKDEYENDDDSIRSIIVSHGHIIYCKTCFNLTTAGQKCSFVTNNMQGHHWNAEFESFPTVYDISQGPKVRFGLSKSSYLKSISSQTGIKLW